MSETSEDVVDVALRDLLERAIAASAHESE